MERNQHGPPIYFDYAETETKIMIKKFFFIFTFYLLTQQSLIYAKINDPRVWSNLYEGCNAEYTSGAKVTKKEFIKYCSCVADRATEKFTVAELVLLESAMLEEQSKDDQLRVAMANKKFGNIVSYCVSKIIN